MNRRTRAVVGTRPAAGRRRQHSRAVDVGGPQLLEPRIAFAVSPALVADINTFAASSLDGEILGSGPTPATSQFVTVSFPSPTNALTVYAADDGAHGRELWVSDGTPAGTRMLQDINRSTASDGRPGGSDPADFFIAGSTLYFSANDGVHGRELWKTDGTAAGTVLVKDLVPGGGAGDPRDYAILPGGEVLFVAQSGLWKTNGTSAGTVAIDPTNTLNLDFDRTSFTRVPGLTRLGGQVLFAGGVLAGGFGTTELWSTDGTLANTAPLRLSGGAPVESPRDFTVVTETETIGFGTSALTFTRDLAFFTAVGGLWRTDGTPSGTVNVSAVEPFSAPVAFGGFTSGTGTSEPTVSGSRLVFAGNDGTTGVELWTIDGSSRTTSPTQIANINQTTAGSFEIGSVPTDFRVAGSNLFFSADDGVNGRELWKYDGSTATMLRDIRPGRTPPGATEIFPTTTTFTASAFVQGAAVGDFNGDGKPDLVLELDAATVGASETLQVLLGVGDGTFTAGASLTYGPQTAGSALTISGLAAGDVNNDGRADIVISRNVRLQDRTSVFLGNGDGTFGAEQVFADTGFTDLTIADIDRDSKLDLVTFTGSPNLMRGNGDGTFQAPTSVRDFSNSGEFDQTDGGAVGDVDGDGDLDVVTLDLTNRRAVLFLNRGDGTFEPERFLSLAADPSSVAVTDVNADGRPDIVTGNTASLSILLGTGGGLFASPQVIALPGAHTTIAIVDVNGDSRLDIVTSTLDTTQVSGVAGVNVLLGRGDGTFRAATRTGPTNGSFFLAVSDFDNSGRPDVAVHAGEDLTVLLNSGSNDGSPAGSEPVLLATAGSTLYFSADDGVHGRELWKSDGTSAATALVKDIHTGSKSAFSQDSSATYLSAAVLGGDLLFAVDDGQHGVELWKSDGTPGGTVLLEDINTKTADGLDGFSSGSGAALSAALFDGAVYFPADDGIHGTELWKRAGDAAPQLVKDLNPDTATFNGGEPEFVTAGGLLYFTWPRQEASLHGGTFPVTDLWRTDGTEAGTILLKQNVGTSGSAALAVLGGKVVFSATDTGGRELWISDGTVAGTTLLKDIAASGDGSPRDFFSFGSLALFTADDGTNGRELWKTDGTPTGTVLLADIDPTTSSGPASGIQNSPGFTLFAGLVYFQANDGTRGAELWRTDGTTTSLVFDLNTTTVSDPLNPAATLPGSGSPYALTPFGSILLFGADDGMNGTSLWKTDGTAVGTSLVRSVTPFPSNGRRFAVAGGKAFFGATDGTRDRLWQTDGTTAGTAVVPDVDPAYVTRDIGNVLAVGNEVFFSAERRFVGPAQPAGRALFRSDGTVAGTSIVELSPGVVGARQFPIIATADRLYFGADDIVRGLELWQLPFDTIPPTVTITTDRTALGSGQTAAVAFTLSELPAGFAAGAVTVTGGTLANFTGSGTAYTATFVPQANFAGTATIRVAAGAFTDAFSNPNTASAVTSIAVDTIAPTVLVTLGAQSLGIGQTAPVAFTLDKPSTTFTPGDVAVAGGTLTNFTGSGTAYSATFVPQPNFAGTATIQVAAGAFTDAFGNPNLGIPALPIIVDTRPRGMLAAGTDGNALTGSREFQYTASGPTTIRIAGLSAIQSGFFSPRMRLTITPTDATASSAATVVRRSYDARSRAVTVTLDRAITVSPASGTLVLGEASAPAARLIDATTGEVRREIGGTDLVAAGYSPVFVTRFQGGLRVAAGDVDGDSFPDLAAAPGATPLRSPTIDFGRSTRLVSLFSGASTPAWPAATVDVAAVFPESAGEGFFVALGNVTADGADSGVRELVVASGRRVAVFEVLVSAGIPSIVPTPLRVIDLPTPGRVTAVATGALFDPSGLDEIIVASTTGTQRVAGTTTVAVLGGVDLQTLRSFAVSSLVESGPARRLVDVFGRGASLAVGDIDGDGRRDLVLGAGSNGLGNFRVLGNEFVTASSATTNVGRFTAAITSELGNSVRFGHLRPVGPKWKPRGGPDFFTPGDVVGPTGSGFNAPLAVATVSGDSSTGGKAWIFAALGATNQTGNEIRRLLSAGPGSWTSDATFRQLPATQAGDLAGRFRPGTGLRLG